MADLQQRRMNSARTPRPPRTTSVLLTGLALSAALLAACSSPAPNIPASGLTSPVSRTAADPTRSVYFSWDPIDQAVRDGAIGFLVVATRTKAVDDALIPYRREYALLASRDRPGTLVIERAGDSDRQPGIRTLTMSAQIGRFGDPDLEAAVLNAIADRLNQAAGSAPD